MVACVTYWHRVRRKSIHSHLRQAAEAVEAAREQPMPADADGYLDGVERLLTHHVDGGATESEAMIYPSPGALETVQVHLSELIEETDGPAAEDLRNARAQILQTILLLYERQHEGRPTSSWR